jgi:hypothetical protein
MMNNGWSELELSNKSKSKLKELTEYKEILINNLKDQLFDKNNLQTEIVKSTIRSILRYSDFSKFFTKSLLEDITVHYEKLKEFYVTPPYIIFHLPNDHSEMGRYHNDTIKFCGQSFTCWTSINNYPVTYCPLSIINKSHTGIIKIIYKILNKLKLSDKLEKVIKFFFIKPFELTPKKNFTYLWHSDLIHRGNLNKTEKPHIALVMRISERPLYYEPTLKIKEFLNSTIQHNDKITFDFNSISSEIFKICEYTIKEKKFLNICKFSQNLKKKMDHNFLKYISFSLSIIAQRLNNELSSKLDLVSLILGKENLISLERFLNKSKNQNASYDILKELYMDQNLLSFQEIFIIKKYKKEDLSNMEHLTKISWN